MPTACIITPGSRINLVSERLEIQIPASDEGGVAEHRQIPLRDLDRLCLGESVQISTPALAELMRREIPVALVSRHGDFLGSFLPPLNSHGVARVTQYHRNLDSGFALAVAGRIIAAKTYNQRRVVQRLGAARRAEGESMGDESVDKLSQLDADLAWMESMLVTLRNSKTIDEIRGCEGAVTARYFQVWSRFLPEEFPFERRSKRPPLNAVNALISFGATLLYHEMVAAIHAQGLDPSLGFLHATQNGRWSLALDLLEPFRPVLVEALALDLLSRRMLNADSFIRSNGGVYLDDGGRRKFYLQYERRMERQFMSESVGHRTTLRQQLEQQAAMLKSALTDSARFEPFLMN